MDLENDLAAGGDLKQEPPAGLATMIEAIDVLAEIGLRTGFEHPTVLS